MPARTRKSRTKPEREAKTVLEQMDRLLLAVLPHVETAGWGAEALRLGARDLNLSSAAARKLFPDDRHSLICHFHDWADREMLKTAHRRSFAKLKVHEKIATLVRARLDAVEPYKAAVRAGLLRHVKPWHTRCGVRAVCRTVDEIWCAAGDTSTDYNYYTKRALLGAVYSSTVLFWLRDTSEGHTATWEFLDQRIANVLILAKLKDSFYKAADSALHRRAA